MDRHAATPKVGDELRATLTTLLSSKVWALTSPELPENWSAVLRSRSDKLYQPGDVEDFWIFDVSFNRHEISLSDSEFGRLPISDAMRPRYVKALRATLDILSRGADATTDSAEQFSEVKGMFNRCLRKDQWDWYTVYKSFGYPKPEVMRQAANLFGSAARALRQGNTGSAVQDINLLRSLDLEHTLAGALNWITASTPRLQRASSLQFSRLEVSVPEDTTAIEEDTDNYVVSRAARAKLERANASHQHTLRMLTKHLETAGYLVEYNCLVDAYCRLKTGSAIFEIKSITPDNERSQCRHALSQLYEYRYLHSLPDASLWLVLSRPPQSTWLVDYLMNDRGVEVLWVADERLDGPSIARLDA